MSKPLAYCSVSGRGFEQWEYNSLLRINDIPVCHCHGFPVINKKPVVTPCIEKTFYYSEEEVKRLCRHASLGNFPADTFDIWWNNIKKK